MMGGRFGLDQAATYSRRAVFAAGGAGLGSIALACFGDATPASGGGARGLEGLPHHRPRAKRVVMLWQGGGPSHVDLFDPKPVLMKNGGAEVPASVRGATKLSTMSSDYTRWPVVPPLWKFKRYGKAGLELSEKIPEMGALADDICLVRSLHTESVNHAPGVTFFMTGSQVPGRPSIGSWLAYGLGSESDELPAFVVLTSSDRQRSCGQLFFDHYWGSGFLPGRYQGVKFRNTGDPVPYLANPPGVSREARRALLDDVAALNREHESLVGDPEVENRIAQYEMAFRMQASVPSLVDFSDEPTSVLRRYGDDVNRQGSYAFNLLIARRLLERGTRFVQVMHSGWDQHTNLFSQLEVQCRDTDGPSAAFVQDLMDRGLLADTLVIWGGEFGRTAYGQGDPPRGRDHLGTAFSWWLAGGGVKAGYVHGATDDYGWNVVDKPVHVHDMQATILHLLGIDHTRLTYRYQGRQFRLTDVHGTVVEDIIA